MQHNISVYAYIYNMCTQHMYLKVATPNEISSLSMRRAHPRLVYAAGGAIRLEQEEDDDETGTWNSLRRQFRNSEAC